MTSYHELERMYIAHFNTETETITEEHAQELLDHLRDNPLLEYSEGRVFRLERYFADINRNKQTKDAHEERWKAAAHEYIALTKRWKSVGATWRPLGSIYEIWEYEGERFYVATSGTYILDTIADARDADVLLTEMVTRKEADSYDGS